MLMRGFVAAAEAGSNTAEATACKTLDNMSELRPLVKELTWTFWGERAHIAVLVDAELACIRSFITAAKSESEGTVSQPIRQ